MKKLVPWLLFFACAVGFALLVDHGKKHLGVPDFIWLALNLTVFMYVLNRFIGQPIGGFLDSRRDTIGQDLATAETKLAEAEVLRREVLARLAQVEQEVAAIKAQADVQGQVEAAQIDTQAKAEEERLVKRIEAEIERRGKEARQRLVAETTELTAQLTRELLEREMTSADRTRVLERSLTALQSVGE